MKIDRLLSIIIYLMNHELSSASVLAERFGVSVRTIVRDIETIDAAGIPIVSVQGPHGGYGIMDTYTLDNRIVSVEDLYYIVTSLKSISDTLVDENIDDTIEKMEGLIPRQDADLLTERNSRLSIDFSMLGGDPRQKQSFRTVKKAVDTQQLLRFTYTSNRLEVTERIVEPMTVAFRWRSWYLYAWCTRREDYRLFRISKIRDAEIIPKRFRRRDLTFEEFEKREQKIPSVHLVLGFDRCMRPLVEDYFLKDQLTEGPGGSLIVETDMPEDGWMYGFILSYGEYVTVIEPAHVRKEIERIARSIALKYDEKI